MATRESQTNIEDKLVGFSPCLGGTELSHATETLFGSSKEAKKKENLERALGQKPKPAILQALLPENEEDPQMKELLHSIHRFAIISGRHSATFEDKYHYGLLIQELAAKLRYEYETERRVMPRTVIIDLLILACDQYEIALELRPKFHAALYNWGVALSELSGLWKSQDSHKALYFLHLASQKYAESVQGYTNNPRGLNNWGLVLQEVSNYEMDISKKLELAIRSIEKFRRSIRIQLDFDHGCYNMGTIYYTHAANIKESSKTSEPSPYLDENGNLVEPLKKLVGCETGLEEAVNILMQTAAQYICLASALQPSSSVYQGSVNIVRHMLPKPYLRVGHLTVARYRSLDEVKESWERQWFALDSNRFASGIGRRYLRGETYVPQKQRDKEDPSPEDYNIPILDILVIERCLELSIPEGSAFWIQTKTHPQGLYFLSEDEESADAWVDVLKLCHYIAILNRTPALNDILGP